MSETTTTAQRLDPHATGRRIDAVLDTLPRRVVACSGGVDSLLLAFLSHRHDGANVVAHSVTPAVPPRATARVVDAAERFGWRLELVRSDEFDDERYLANPTDRCYFCKTNLYAELDRIATAVGAGAAGGATVLSGANVDDLGEYRPGLTAAAEHDVRHPYVEADVTKADIRALAAAHQLPWADLAAAPCLASRLYTGTRVTATRLRAVDVGEELLRARTGLRVVRCRLDGDDVRIEVPADDRDAVTPAVVAAVGVAMRSVVPSLRDVALDAAPYAPGRSFLPVA